MEIGISSKASDKRLLILEIISGSIGIGFLIYALRSLLLIGETTPVHDHIHYNYPAFQFLADNILDGHFPLWNPFSHGGEPFYPLLFQVKFLDPVPLLTIFLGQFLTGDVVLLFNWNHFIRSLVMFFGVYISLRIFAEHVFIRLSLIPILLYSSFVLSPLRVPGLLQLFLWFPYIAYFLVRIVYCRDYRWHNWLLMGPLIGLNWLSNGFVGLWTFFLFFAVGLVLFKREPLRELFKARMFRFRFAVMSVIVLAMMMPNVILLLEKDKYVFPVRMIDPSYRKNKPKLGPQQYEGSPSDVVQGINMPYDIISYTGTFSTMWDFIQLISPDGNRKIRGPDVKGWGEPSEAYMYLGVLTWAIAILGIVVGRHDLKRVWLFILFGFGLLMLGPPGGLHRLLYYVYPPIWFLRHTHLFVLFFLYIFLFFYILGFNHIFYTKGVGLFSRDSRNDNSVYSSSAIFSMCIIGSVCLMTRLEYPLSNLAFCFILLIVAVGWFIRKRIGRRGMFISLVGSQIILVSIFHPNMFVFYLYILIVLGIPLLLLWLVTTWRNVPEGLQYGVRCSLLVIVGGLLSGDLIYSFLRSDFVYSSQRVPANHIVMDTSAQKASLPYRRLISSQPYYSTTDQGFRYTSLFYRQPYVFSPPLRSLFDDTWIDGRADTEGRPESQSFVYALKSPRWNCFILLKNYFKLIHSDIFPKAMMEVFTVGKPIFQKKAGALVVEADEAIESLKEGGPDVAERFLRKYVFVERDGGQSLEGSGLTLEGYEPKHQAVLDSKETSYGGILKEKISYTRVDSLPESKNLGGSIKSIQASSIDLPFHSPLMVLDGNPDSIWHIALSERKKPSWLKIDFGQGNKEVVNKIKARPRKDIPQQFFTNAYFEGSNDGRKWERIALLTQFERPRANRWISWSFENEKDFRFYRLYFVDERDMGPFYSFAELEVYNDRHWMMIDLGEDSREEVNFVRMRPEKRAPKPFFRKITIDGSNDKRMWDKLTSLSLDTLPETCEWISWFFPNDEPYRYYRIRINGHCVGGFSRSFSNLEVYRTSISLAGYDRIDMKVNADEKSILYWADGYDEGWRAYINGEEVPVYRANFNFKAIVLRKGVNNIKFVYDPVLFKVALLVFYGSIIVSIVGAVVARFSSVGRGPDNIAPTYQARPM